MIFGRILLLTAINILAVAVVDTFPHGYARPAYVKESEERKPYGRPSFPNGRVDIESSLPRGEYEQDIESERGLFAESKEVYYAKKVVTTRKPYAAPVIKPHGKGYEGIGRNGGDGRVSYARPNYN